MSVLAVATAVLGIAVPSYSLRAPHAVGARSWPCCALIEGSGRVPDDSDGYIVLVVAERRHVLIDGLSAPIVASCESLI